MKKLLSVSIVLLSNNSYADYEKIYCNAYPKTVSVSISLDINSEVEQGRAQFNFR